MIFPPSHHYYLLLPLLQLIRNTAGLYIKQQCHLLAILGTMTYYDLMVTASSPIIVYIIADMHMRILYYVHYHLYSITTS